MPTADPFAAALALWHFDPLVIGALAIVAGFYLLGWLRIRRHIRYPHDTERLAAFLAGLMLLFIAGESPLDALDATYVSAHMTQHLLLLMLAPGLILLGQPMLPLLRGLPKPFVRTAFGPLWSWPQLRSVFSALSSPPAALVIFIISTLGWHVPFFYELALNSPPWHAAEHACFFWTGILFWWPILRPNASHSRWPQWVGIPYLVAADLSNTLLSAFFLFSGRVLYPTYAALHMPGRSPLEDQMLAGAIMWVPGSLVYLVPAVLLTVRLLSPARPATPMILRRS